MTDFGSELRLAPVGFPGRRFHQFEKIAPMTAVPNSATLTRGDAGVIQPASQPAGQASHRLHFGCSGVTLVVLG